MGLIPGLGRSSLPLICPSLNTKKPFHFFSQNLDIGLELVRKGYAIELAEDMEKNRAVPVMLDDLVSEPLLSFGVLLWDKPCASRQEGF